MSFSSCFKEWHLHFLITSEFKVERSGMDEDCIISACPFLLVRKRYALPNIPLPDFHLHLIGLFPYDIFYTSPILSHIPHIITHYLSTQSMITSSCGGSLIVKHCPFYGHCCNFALLPFMQGYYTCNVLHMILVSPQ